MIVKSGNAGIEIGDIFLSVWGYEQTNINYYQVVRVVGKTMVEVKEINYITLENGAYYDYKPAVDNFKNDLVLKRKVLHYGADPTIEINEVISADLSKDGANTKISSNPYFH